MDLETLFTTVYVLVDDLYKAHCAQGKPQVGAPAKLSDSEVLTIAIVGQWRVGVPWQSERGVLRYLHAHQRGMFPHLLQVSAFNRRVRYLWGVLVRLQQEVAQLLYQPEDTYECVDSLPLPAGSLGQYSREQGHWLWDSTIGRNAGGDWFWGDRLLMSVRPRGAISGWLIGAAHLNDRWLMEGFVSTRQATPRLQGPVPSLRTRRDERPHLPGGHIGAWTAVGRGNPLPYVADQNFNGYRWTHHWLHAYHARVIAVPPPNSRNEPPFSPAHKRWVASHRQIIETVFAVLEHVFRIKHLQPHSRWGQYTRLAAVCAAFNIGLFLNHLLHRPFLAFATLIT